MAACTQHNPSLVSCPNHQPHARRHRVCWQPTSDQHSPLSCTQRRPRAQSSRTATRALAAVQPGGDNSSSRESAAQPLPLSSTIGSSSSSSSGRSPADVVQECLVLLRKTDVAEFVQHALPGSIPAQAPLLPLGSVGVIEAGPLARCAGVLDCAARRVLPGHLLRRCAVLSVLQRRPGQFLLRVAITACTGEEAVQVWELQQQGQRGTQQQQHNGDGSGGGGASCEGRGPILVRSVTTQGPALEAGSSLLPTVPHPRNSPEAVVAAQLHALRRGDVHAAASFGRWPATALGAPANGDCSSCGDAVTTREGEASGSAQASEAATAAGLAAAARTAPWGRQYRTMQLLLSRPPYSLLLDESAEVEWGPSALPTQRTFLQLAWVSTGARGSKGGARKSSCSDSGDGRTSFMWRLCMQANGCWMIESIMAPDHPAGDDAR